MPEVVTAAAVKTELALTAPADEPKLLDAVAAAAAFVARYHTAPADNQPWPADYRLGAVKLAANLYRNSNSPGVSEAFGGAGDQAFRRATDVQIEQLLRIGRFAAPLVG